MSKSAVVVVALVFGLVAVVAPAQAFVLSGPMDADRDTTTESYISAGTGNIMNHACTVDVVNIGGVCFSVSKGETYSFTVVDASSLEVGGEYRFITASGVGASEFFCDRSDGTITAPQDDDVVLQIFVGGAVNCGSVATIGHVELTNE